MAFVVRSGRRGNVLRCIAVGWSLLSLQCGGGGGASPGADGGHGVDSSTTRGPDGSHGKDGAGDARRDGRADAATHDAQARDAFIADAPANDAPATLKGAIQKGPFVLGSSVQLSAISSTGSPTGTVFNTTTTDDLGDFNVTFSYRGYVDMQAQGFYYDEVSGELSAAPITLRALYDVSTGGSQSAYINIVTHLAHDRAVNLMSGGMTLEAAEARAESDLISALAIGGTGFSPGGVGVALNELGTDNDQNAYLFAVSAIMVETVIQQSGTASLDAQLQELIDTVASNLAVGGTLPAPVTAELQAAEVALDVDLTMDLFADRLLAIASTATPANLDRAVDSDGDGYRNTVDTCPLVANPDQSVIPTGVLCSVTRHTTFLPQVWVGPPVVADYENSGHASAVLALPAGFALAIGDGTGRFAAPVALTLPGGFTPTFAYDINKDGNQDLVGDTGWVAGDGAGHFGALSPFGGLTAGAGGLVVGDFNGDSIPDVAGFGTNGILVLIATAPGVFNSPITVLVGGTWLFANDLNDDGKPDLVAVNDGGQFVALLGDGTGHFQAGAPTVIPNSGGYAGAAVADVDGDGTFDVVVWNGNVWVVFGDGTGNFGSPALTSATSGSVAVGDYDSDGRSDLWVGYPQGSSCASVAVMLSAGRSFGAPQTLHATPGDCGGGLLVTHDLNGDGIPDIVMLNEEPDTTSTLQGYIVGACPGCACAGTMCHGVCVDTSSNVFNCGACGDTCELGATCSAGTCACNGMPFAAMLAWTRTRTMTTAACVATRVPRLARPVRVACASVPGRRCFAVVSVSMQPPTSTTAGRVAPSAWRRWWPARAPTARAQGRKSYVAGSASTKRRTSATAERAATRA